MTVFSTITRPLLKTLINIIFQAENKGVNSTISGWIFGAFALVQFIASPFFGRLVSRGIVINVKDMNPDCTVINLLLHVKRTLLNLYSLNSVSV